MDSQLSEYAKANPFEQWRLSWQDEYDLLCIEPSRALAECEAKRRIVELHTDPETPTICPVCHYQADYEMLPDLQPCRTLRLLALPYADHPGYREEWKP